MDLENEPSYNISFFRKLGFRKKEALSLERSWNRRLPQTIQEVRQGRITEEENRLASAQGSWAKKLKEK